MRVCSHMVALVALAALLVSCETSNGVTLDAQAGGLDDVEGCEDEAPHCEGSLALSCEEGLPVTEDCASEGYCSFGACVPSLVSLPEDAAPHADIIEWWYYTGHVTDGEREFGFEIALFQQRLEDLLPIFAPNAQDFGWMCHVALLDKTAGTHVYAEAIHTENETWSSAPVDLHTGNCHLRLSGDGHDHITGVIPEGQEGKGLAGAWSFDLQVDATKEPTHHGSDGVIPMAYGGNSYYYSYSHLDAVGTIETSETSYEVTGQAWMDHQWGDFQTMDFKGWDWWSMQLDDGWQIMLFLFRSWDNNEVVVKAGSIVDPQGNVQAIDGLDAFSIDSLRTWSSQQTDGTYPLDWDIHIPDPAWNLQIRTHLDPQEVPNLAKNYWEGATTITGTRGTQPVTGVGYTELTGYATDLLGQD